MTEPLTSLDKLSAALADKYTIEREIGAGGMATVYLAQDIRHRRKVAIKVLHPELTAVLGPERFLNEIELTANLQHPHILPLFDSGAADTLLYYVMPYVQGETLRMRLSREQQLPIAEAVRIASDVADALEYAHKHGVVHRDIKPENVLLHDGRPLVADFGIALAVQQAGGTRMTQTGMSLGTPQYMAPEQAMGDKAVDHRADIYALGAVTYEMLTGEPPFTGPNAQAVVAKILTTDPSPLQIKRRSIPPHVEAAVLAALEKMPADRFATAARFAEALAGRGAEVLPSRSAVGVATRSDTRWRYVFMGAAGTALTALALAAFALSRASSRTDATVTRQFIELTDTSTINQNFPTIAVSPDGSTIVFRENIPGSALRIKNAAELGTGTLPGTEGAQNPTFSPDGQWIAFVQDTRLKKIGVRGGSSITVADSAIGGYGGVAWLDDGTLVYVATSQYQLRRVSAAGGGSTGVFSDSSAGGRGFGHPAALPGARGVLFGACSSGCVQSSLHVLDLETGRMKVLLEDVIQGWHLPTGHLLYVRPDGAALVAPFDLKKLEISGGAVPVLEGIAGGAGFTSLAWSPSGTVVYVSGAAQGRDLTVSRVTRDGAATPVDTSWTGPINSIALSPDGRRLAVGTGLGTSALNIWIKHLDRGPFTKLTFGGADRRPAWSPDGKTVAFVRDTLTTSIVVARPVDGTGPERTIVRLPRQVQSVTWSPDGAWIIVRTDNAAPGGGDVVGIRESGDTTPVTLVGSSFQEMHPAVSPDGRWLAFTSDESGRNEVYVRPFPNTGAGLWQVSTGGAIQPRWSPSGEELYMLGATGKILAASLRTSPAFEVTGVRDLFRDRGFVIDPFHHSYEVTRDGAFLFLSEPETPGVRERVVRIDNWFTDVRARVKQ